MISLRQAKRIFLDTAPLIYLVERNETYWNAVVELFSRIDAGGLELEVACSEGLVRLALLGARDQRCARPSPRRRQATMPHTSRMRQTSAVTMMPRYQVNGRNVSTTWWVPGSRYTARKA